MVLLNANLMMASVSASLTLALSDAHSAETVSSHLKSVTTLDVHLVNATLVVPNLKSATKTPDNVNAVKMLLEDVVTDLPMDTTSQPCMIKSTKWKMVSRRTIPSSDLVLMKASSLVTA